MARTRPLRNIFARHVAYIPSDLYSGTPTTPYTDICSGTGAGIPTTTPTNGMPIVRKLNPDICATALPEFPGSRHIGFTPLGIPIVVTPWACCDAVSDTYVEDTCWPIGDGPGITDIVYAYVTNVDSCVSAYKQKVKLTYDSGLAKWAGSVTLRGGTLNLLFSCNPLDFPDEPGKFLLEWSGCNTGSLSAGYTCADPLIVTFGNIDVPDCCDCPLATTTVTAAIAITVVGNCHKVIMARHVSYANTGTALIPVVAKEKNCSWDESHLPDCGDVKCGLTVDIVGDTACGCFTGTYSFPYVSNAGGDGTHIWENLGVGSCIAAGQFNLGCVTNCDGTITLTMTANCGVTNSGSGSVTIDADEMEDLDVTFDMTMSDPSAVCTGECVYQWNDMAASWLLFSSSCSSGCDVCPNGPIDTTPGTVDGEFRTESCPSLSTTCCVGTLTIRVMR